jgi:mRNA interferase MazF
VTSSDTDARSIRPVIEPSAENGLRVTSRLMIDKITTVARPKLQRRIGRLEVSDMALVGRAIVVFLGLADAPSR